MHDKHQKFFDALANEWDLAFTSEDLERLSHIVEQLNVEEGWDVLDLGCGTGVLFDMVRRRVGQHGMVTGVDFSFEMAEKAHRNFPFENVNVVDADASCLPLADSSFNMGLAFAAFPHFSDKEHAIEELHRVLKNGAVFYIIHLESSKEITAAHQSLGGAVENDAIPPETMMHQMFEKGRFVDISIEDHPGLYLARATNSK